MVFDKIIIGAGLYGLYCAHKCKDQKILVLECENEAFSRATYINQARVHMGYHYPRSYSTAIKSAKYFERFNEDFGFCIENQFDKVYAISKKFSWTSADQFRKFCNYSGIMCEDISTTKYFKDSTCSGAFLTREYTYDAMILKDYYLSELSKHNNIEIKYNSQISKIEKHSTNYEIVLEDGQKHQTDFLINATYASTNQISNMLGYDLFDIKYELCEIILCETNDKLKDVGITVMDGPFFSIMPFGKTGLHSLTSVTFTPHVTSYDSLPKFKCQELSDGYCSPEKLGNCNLCKAKPKSAFSYMSSLARKYLKEEYGFTYKESLFSMKPILQASEVDDSRPTVIKKFSDSPTFISVLSGKINTVYDMDDFLL